MQLFFRFLGTMALATRRPPLEVLEDSLLELRVWPGDLDINRHMTNARYLAHMDLGRTDLVVRQGMLPLFFKRRIRPLVGSANLRFFRSLEPLSRYTLRTRFASWDSKWFYFEQRFERDGDVVAAGFVKAVFRGPDGNIAPAEVFAELGYTGDPPPRSEALRLWLESDAELGRAAVRHRVDAD